MKQLNIKNMKSKIEMSKRSGGESKSKGLSSSKKISSTSFFTTRSTDVYRIEISPKSVLMLFVTVAAIYLFIKLWPAVLILFFAFAITSAVLPSVKKMQSLGLGKHLSVFVVYLLFFVFMMSVLFIIAVPFVNELKTLLQDLPSYLDHLSINIVETVNKIPMVSLDEAGVASAIQNFYQDNILKGGATAGLSGFRTTFQTLGTVGTVVAGFLFSLSISVYMVLDHDSFLDVLLLRISHPKKRALVKSLIEDVESKLGNWLVGQGTVSLAVGIISWVFLFFLGVPFALPLAFLSGLFTTVPNIGPFISGIPAVIIGFLSGDAVTALVIIIGYMIIQEIERSVISPKVMGNVVGVKPLIVMVGILIGLTLGGVVGAILTIPTLVIMKIGLDFYQSLKRLEAEDLL